MNDHSASDMRYGDLSEAQLKALRLTDVSAKVDPYTLMKIPETGFATTYGFGLSDRAEKVSKQECINILFDEFRSLAKSFALYGVYSHLIKEMITHMQHNKGASFRDPSLDQALRQHILQDNSRNSTRLLLQRAFDININWKERMYPENKKNELTDAIIFGRLPKFDRFKDSFNGMGMTVHDTWATHITIQSLQINEHSYRALVRYKVQDHFGLDDVDIANPNFRQFRFFRIWFVLQRYNQFGFRPFMTDMETVIELKGERKK
ncbi:DUF3289 family protein [Enterobacteriaceae bacterium H20N1]|uniref:DUF3289 family protein n=2 Tax=Dryocola boscaweniae TaxID=2925397 RepID=A0A9X2W5C6_9ENTR|nr:DUF3289 family protein [Dryocola boscaweniae]MCT4718431.1 DUF3289 family protein [Dryocola boscaweniae]